LRKDRGIVIRIKRKKATSRRKLGRGEAKAGKIEEKEFEEKEEIPQEEAVEKPEETIAMEEPAGRLVLPGDLVGTSEEYTPKNGTFVDKGNIYAASTGMVKINPKDRSISVAPVTNTPPRLNVGDIVIGQVTDMKESVVLVEIAAIKGRGEREIVNVEQAAIHVSNVKDAYVKELRYEFAPFDIVKARVIDMRNMRLSTVDKELGVMKAYCSSCRTVLKKDNSNLKCPVCGRTETRKLSSDYGTGVV